MKELKGFDIDNHDVAMEPYDILEAKITDLADEYGAEVRIDIYDTGLINDPGNEYFLLFKVTDAEDSNYDAWLDMMYELYNKWGEIASEMNKLLDLTGDLHKSFEVPFHTNSSVFFPFIACQ